MFLHVIIEIGGNMADISEEKKWQYIDYDTLYQIEDNNLQREYRKKMTYAVRFVINPLYMYALKLGFDDSAFQKQKSIHGMVEELKNFYEKMGIDHDQRVDIVINGRHRK